ncbi:MAG: sulfate ABC transporter permease subunit CysT [Bacilli bacterium]
MTIREKKRRRPGFTIATSYTVLYLSIIVLLPLAMLFIGHTVSFREWLDIVTDPRAIQSYKISFGAAFIAALLNLLFGTWIAWTLVRYDFFGKKVIDALIDLPFAIPTAVAGITLATVYSPEGWIGKFFETRIAFSPLGIIIALTFITFPFVVRMVQPILERLNRDYEAAAQTLGANRFTIFLKVILPQLYPAMLIGFSLAFSRAIGEYGSVIFIAGNIPMKTEITPLLIMAKLEQYDYAGASALAIFMLLCSLVILIVINFVHKRYSRYL